MADTIVCDSSTVTLNVLDLLGPVEGTKVYDLTTSFTGVVQGVEPTTTDIAIGTPIVNQLINRTNQVQTVTYNFRYRLNDPRNGDAPFCDHGIDTTITIYVNPTPRFEVSVADTIVCDSTEITLNVLDLLGPVEGTKVYDLTTSFTGVVQGVEPTTTDIAIGTPIVNTLVNRTNQVQTVTYNFRYRLNDPRNGDAPFCDHGMDTTITIYVNPTPRFEVSVADTIVCDSSTVTLNVLDLLGPVEGTKVYDLTTSYTGTVEGVEPTTTDIAIGTPIVNQLVNRTNQVQTVTYNFRYRFNDPRNGDAPFCDNGTDTTITIYVNPTPRFLVTTADTVPCDSTTIIIDVTDLLNNVEGAKVYDLTVTYNGGSVLGVSPDDEYDIDHDIIDNLINLTDEYQVIRYNFRYKIRDDRPGQNFGYCDHGVDTTIVIYLEPTPKVNYTIINDTICDGGEVNYSLTTPSTAVFGVEYNVTVLNFYPEITGFNNQIGLDDLSSPIFENVFNSGDTARMIQYVIRPFTIDPLGSQKCGGIRDTISVWVNPTPRVIPINIADRICYEDFTDIELTTPTVMTHGIIEFDYTVALSSAVYVTGNTTADFDRQVGEHIIFDYTNDDDTIQSVFYYVTPKNVITGCANGTIETVEVKLHPTPIRKLEVASPLTCHSGSDLALRAILSREHIHLIQFTGMDRLPGTNWKQGSILIPPWLRTWVPVHSFCMLWIILVVLRILQ